MLITMSEKDIQRFVYTKSINENICSVRLSDLHLLVLMIHRAVCKPCGHWLSFLFQISHTPPCFLLATR